MLKEKTRMCEKKIYLNTVVSFFSFSERVISSLLDPIFMTLTSEYITFQRSIPKLKYRFCQVKM